MSQPKADPKAQSALENEEKESCMAGRFCWKLWTSHLGLFIILIAYSFAGAGIMHAIEGYYAQQARMERNQSLHIVDFKQHFVNQTLPKWNDSEMNTKTMYELLQQYEQEKARYEHDIPDYDYWDWLLFCLTVYTTIGYGVVIPATRPGRIATMAYATIGVPLFLMTMGKVGKLLTRAVKRFWSYVRRCYYLKRFRKVRKSKLVQKLTGSSKQKNNEAVRSSSTKDKNLLQVDIVDNTSFVSFEVDDEFDLHPLVAIFVTLVYIVFGSFMYVQWEDNWEYHDAFYFVFISISTIGFGDLHPQHPKFFLLSSIYILFGLALVAMVIEVLMDFFKETGQTVAEHIDQLPEILIGDSDDDEEDEEKNNLKAGLVHIASGFQPQEVKRYSVS